MAYVLNYNLTPFSERIIKILYHYRGMTAKQLATFICAPFPVELSSEKSTYNYLRKLKQQNLVSSYKLQANVANGSLYYLTQKGFQLAKDLLNITVDQKGEGWFCFGQEYDEQEFADFEYDVYLPPMSQTAHHLMLVDFFIKATLINENYELILHRNNLYAAETYFINKQKYRYRPDAEILIGNKRFAIEIDRATEGHEKLLEKFNTYKRYLDYVLESGDPTKKIDGIIFVVENKRRLHGIGRRWTNILAAYFKTLDGYKEDVNLIMTSLDSVNETLLFEAKRDAFEKQAEQKIKALLHKEGYPETIIWNNCNTGEIKFVQGLNDSDYEIYFVSISQQFESRLYTRYIDFCDEGYFLARDPEEQEKIKDLEYMDINNVIFYNLLQPYIVENISHYLMNGLQVYIEDLRHTRNKFLSFNEHLNFSLFD